MYLQATIQISRLEMAASHEQQTQFTVMYILQSTHICATNKQKNKYLNGHYLSNVYEVP